MALRTCWRFTPLSSIRLMSRSMARSWNEYSRWEPEPLASFTDGRTRPVRAQ